MSVLDEGNPLGVAEVLEDTEEYHDFVRACGSLEEIEETEESFNATSTLDKDMVSSLESKYPGLILDNTRFEERYTETGHQIGLESLQRRKAVVVSDVATAVLGVVDKLQQLTAKLNGGELKGSLASTLQTLEKRAKSVEIDSVKLTDMKLMIAYDKFMGTEATDVNQVKSLVSKIGTYKNPIQCLKDFPSSNYDKMFTPLLADSAADNSRVFAAFSEMNDTYADTLVSTVRETQYELNNVINSGDHGRLSRYTDSLIPKGIDQVLHDIVASLELEVSASKSLLNQTRKIGSQLSKKLRTSEDSINKKAVVLNSITHRSGQLDKGFKDIAETTNKLTSLKKDDATMLKDLRQGLKTMRQERSNKDKLKQTITPVGRQASKQYRRLIGELRNLWDLINLFVQISVVYVSCYSVLNITLDNFSIRLLSFSNNIRGLNATDKTEGQT